MSVRFRQLFRVMVSSTVLASSILAVALWVGPAAADTFDTTFIAQINGAQETPPNSSPSTGVAFLTFNKDNSNLCYAISYTPLEGTEFLAHFHGPAAKGDLAGPGIASPILHSIDPPGPSPIGSPKNGCVLVSDKQQVKDLKAGLWYINIHTMPNHPAGEVRGQVLPLKIKYKNVPPIQPVASPSGAFLN
ncbi:MAG TPA: CHRD domain-containing protein [Candidatus Binatia bacterium]|nr:CHRD domain-containing protein [Candidatus Binatia bacterium]